MRWIAILWVIVSGSLVIGGFWGYVDPYALLQAPQFDQLFNLGEAFLWIAISWALLFQWNKHPGHRKSLLTASLAFFLFGLSDLIEIQTRAWYRPWGLLVLKAACIAVLAVLLVQHLSNQKSPRP